MIDKSRIPSVVYYPDYIAGFFGINGTHRLTLFCIFFICLNMYVYKFKKVKYYKRIPLFVLLISLLLFALSTQNDNNTFFILYPLFALFLYSILYTIDYKRIGRLYGIFYIHMAVLMIVSRFIKCENWYAYWILRFVLTAAISYIMVYIGQIVLKKHKKLLRYIGFV